MEQLAMGVYDLPTNCKAFVRAGKVYVVEKRVVNTEILRCGTCRHCIVGRATYGHGPSSHTTVCDIRPKTNGLLNGYPKDIERQQRYYATSLRKEACEKYEPNDNTNE